MHDITVFVVAKETAGLDVLRSVRKWISQRNSAAGVNVKGAFDLQKAVSDANDAPDRTVVVTVGYPARKVLEHLKSGRQPELEIIVKPPPGQKGRYPSSSHLDITPVLTVEDPMPAIRKSLIRFRTKKIVTIRQLATRDELRKYFALRYKVWKALNYIAPEKDCPQSQWELDFTDRFAYPLGAFLKTDPSELVGCVRVVHAFGTVARNYVKMINDLIADHPPLKKCFKLPDAIQHPFDIESFPDFPAYYRRFICEGIPHAEVSRVIVEETFRKKGIGEALVDSAISLARRQGVEVMFLACLSKHESFYNRCGFKTIEVKAANGAAKQMKCSCFVNVEVPAIAMECWLV